MTKRIAVLLMLVLLALGLVKAAAAEDDLSMPALVSETARLQASCDSGTAADCTALGAMYGNGQGVTQDLTKAFQLFSKSCELGGGTACSDLGMMYGGSGNYISVDNVRAAQLQKRSCDLGSGQGCFYLGKIYQLPQADGFGLPTDLNLAQTALKKLCDLRYENACSALEALGNTHSQKGSTSAVGAANLSVSNTKNEEGEQKTDNAGVAGPAQYTISLKDIGFQPQTLVVKAGEPFKLTINNETDKAGGFITDTLSYEKVVQPHTTIGFFMEKLKPGVYAYKNDFAFHGQPVTVIQAK